MQIREGLALIESDLAEISHSLAGLSKKYPDIVVASAKAYLSALNKLHSTTERVAAQG